MKKKQMGQEEGKYSESLCWLELMSSSKKKGEKFKDEKTIYKSVYRPDRNKDGLQGQKVIDKFRERCWHKLDLV